jgi:putative ABC transport system substrate-binding protein
MNRREFITLLGGAAGWPLAARAQQPKMPVIGFLSGSSPQTIAREIAGFLQGLGETGYVEGQNIAIEYRWGAGQLNRLPMLAAELVDRPVAVLVSHTDLAIVAARAATTTIPIVFLTGADPVRAGFVASLNRPRGNLTGATFLSADLGPKRLGLLHELVPKGTVIAVLVDQNFPDGVSQLTGVQEAARRLKRQIIVLNARTESDIDTAFAALVQQRAGALSFLGGNFFNTRKEQIITLFLPFMTGLSFQSRAV